MKPVLFLLIFILVSCAHEEPKFSFNAVCSAQSIKYIRNPRNKSKMLINDQKFSEVLASTKTSMQTCYDEFRKRTGQSEFNTCLVVGVDEQGKTDFFNFSSNEADLDRKFLSCADNVARNLPYVNFGRNYILVQAYQFYEL